VRLKTMFPWLCAVVFLIATAALYSSNQKQSAELAQLRQESQELQKLRAASEEIKTAGVQSDNDELIQLRKDHEDLLRLRGEVRQLREERKQLNQQVQKAQAEVQTAQTRVAQAEASRVNPAAPQAPALTAEQAAAAQAFRTRYGLQPQGAATPEQAQLNACLNNLRLIDGAKQQWALENSRPVGGLVGSPDIAPYLKSDTVPTCPGGGAYTINPIGINPICSIPSHVLPKQ